MTGWGRERKKSDTASGYRFFALGAALIVFGLAAFSSGGRDRDETVLGREETAAAALMIGTDAPFVETGDEPPGYLNGHWNLWEYIGDKLASAISGR